MLRITIVACGSHQRLPWHVMNANYGSLHELTFDLPTAAHMRDPVER